MSVLVLNTLSEFGDEVLEVQNQILSREAFYAFSREIN